MVSSTCLVSYLNVVATQFLTTEDLNDHHGGQRQIIVSKYLLCNLSVLLKTNQSVRLTEGTKQ